MRPCSSNAKASFATASLRILTLALALSTNRETFGSEQTIRPGSMPRIATIDARFQSYNIEMVTVTGGPFWRPYAQGSAADQDLYADRLPIDLANTRLRTLAAALSPAYLRVSGTWANSTWFSDSDTNATRPPAGFNSVLSRAEWRAVVRADRYILRHQRGHARCGRYLDYRSGAPPLRLHAFPARTCCGRRVHERAESCGPKWRAGGI